MSLARKSSIPIAKLFRCATVLVFALKLLGGCPAAAEGKLGIEVMPQLGHSEFVASVAFSPDGRSVLSARARRREALGVTRGWQ